MLRKKGVVGKFVEFYGPGMSKLSLPDRATIANMAPEYGATMGFFPVDAETLAFLQRTGRTAAEVELVERYTKELGIFRTDAAPAPIYTKKLTLDLSTIEPSLAGPKRPQDRVPLTRMKQAFEKALAAPLNERGFALNDAALHRTGTVQHHGSSTQIGHGAVVIAAITSCTNTSNPSVMLAAGLLAKKAVARGLQVKPYVKTSLAPGSRVVTDYLDKAGLTDPLRQLGFHTVGYGCTTCIGNSGPLPDPVAAAVTSGELVASAVLSGNRNFEGRVNPLVKANYLASPPLVVAYALAGTTDIDLTKEPLGQDPQGHDVYLQEIWPSDAEIAAAIAHSIQPEMFLQQYSHAFDANEMWNRIAISGGDLYAWDEKSTYIQEPPFLVELTREVSPIQPLRSARVLAVLGDSITTDHISPAGSIKEASPAGSFLKDNQVQKADFNSYGARRGNHEVMMRGTFANVRIKNLMMPAKADGSPEEGGVTLMQPSGERAFIYDAAMRYQAAGVPTIVIGGEEYGSGSSRDWAAKGTQLLGVRAVIARSYERIHRSNLVGMGVLALQFKGSDSAQSLGLKGDESYDIVIPDNLQPQQDLEVVITRKDGTRQTITVLCRIDTPIEVDYFMHGGILPYVLRELLAA